MEEATIRLSSTQAEAPLSLAEQISRDARLRVVAAGAVVLVHSAYPPSSPVLAAQPEPWRTLAALAFDLVVSFPVNAFVLLAFLGFARASANGAAGQRLRALAWRLVPAQLFWTFAFLLARALASRALPSPRAVIEGVALGNAAAHLYFVPVLLLLAAAAPLWAYLARSPWRALVAAAALAVVATALQKALGHQSSVLRLAAGALGFAPFAVAGLALARSWRGVGPGAGRRPAVLVAGMALVAAGAALVASRALADDGRGGPFQVGPWLGLNALALGTPLLVLCVRGPASPRMVRLASLSLGVYFVHPFFVQLLRAAQARVPALAAHPLELIAVNAALAAALSVVAVALLARTPLRRFVL